ncbi:MAG: hypothetical protein C5B49_06015 [Bdellovibrio sp.]|nr:MAG: hypothetical protein C5B49_06015 [Bdellovibrio sp.]
MAKKTTDRMSKTKADTMGPLSTSLRGFHREKGERKFLEPPKSKPRFSPYSNHNTSLISINGRGN